MPKYMNFKLVPAIVLFVIFAVVGCKKMARVNPKVNIPDTDIYATGYIVKNRYLSRYLLEKWNGSHPHNCSFKCIFCSGIRKRCFYSGCNPVC